MGSDASDEEDQDSSRPVDGDYIDQRDQSNNWEIHVHSDWVIDLLPSEVINLLSTYIPDGSKGAVIVSIVLFQVGRTILGTLSGVIIEIKPADASPDPITLREMLLQTNFLLSLIVVLLVVISVLLYKQD